MRNVILYIAESLDGYIADDLDGFSFLHEYDDLESIQNAYLKLVSKIDTVVMGRKTYEVINEIGSWPYNDFKSYVISGQKKDTKNKSIEFTDDVISLIKELKMIDGKDIWLVGGGVLIETFIKNSLIDEYMIAIIPKLIGSGKRLFNKIEHYEKLKLVNIEQMNDIVMLTYHRIT